MSTEIKLRDFESQVLYFNGMYKLPVAPYPTIQWVVKDEQAKKTAAAGNTFTPTAKELVIKRLLDFRETLLKELNEIDDIVGKLNVPDSNYSELELLTDLADWLGDIQVYCVSEMVKFGIPQKDTVKIIMSSNFSKLDADGLPIYDSRGKVEKGPMYWKPEPQIKEMLKERIEDAVIIREHSLEDGIVWRAGGN